jgi:hypothetical protein
LTKNPDNVIINYKLNYKLKGETIMKASKSMIMKAITAKCLECCCGDKKEVKACEIDRCELFPFRNGKTEINEVVGKEVKISKTRAPMTDEHKAALKAGRDAAKAAKG